MNLPTPVAGIPLETQNEIFVVEKVSDMGWFVCILGCFVCPPFNFLGLCMKDTIVVEVPCTDMS